MRRFISSPLERFSLLLYSFFLSLFLFATIFTQLPLRSLWRQQQKEIRIPNDRWSKNKHQNNFKFSKMRKKSIFQIYSRCCTMWIPRRIISSYKETVEALVLEKFIRSNEVEKKSSPTKMYSEHLILIISVVFF